MKCRSPRLTVTQGSFTGQPSSAMAHRNAALAEWTSFAEANDSAWDQLARGALAAWPMLHDRLLKPADSCVEAAHSDSELTGLRLADQAPAMLILTHPCVEAAGKVLAEAVMRAIFLVEHDAAEEHIQPLCNY